jgi:hypothetical protein
MSPTRKEKAERFRRPNEDRAQIRRRAIRFVFASGRKREPLCRPLLLTLGKAMPRGALIASQNRAMVGRPGDIIIPTLNSSQRSP